MSPDLLNWLLGFLAASAVAGAARARRSLSVDGAVAATLLGAVLVGAAGWWSGLMIVAFFGSSSLLSHAGRTSRIDQARGAERDRVQVLANGGIALVAALLYALTGNDGWITLLAGSIAAVNADTWSTEIGRRSRSLPRLIISGRKVAAGTSGAVSGRGLLGAAGGAALIGALAWIGWETGWLPGTSGALAGALAVTAGGFAGSLVDSLLGATVQEQRWCATCGKLTEARIHRCGTVTRHAGGIRGIDNDVVNVTCATSGAVLAWILARSLG